jgi:hypothetical protein
VIEYELEIALDGTRHDGVERDAFVPGIQLAAALHAPHLGQRIEVLVLVEEALVERSHRAARGARDVRHRQLIEVLAPQELEAGGQQAVARLLRAALLDREAETRRGIWRLVAH